MTQRKGGLWKHLLLLGEATTLLEISASAEAGLDGAGDDKGTRRTLRSDYATGILLAFRPILAGYVIDLCAQGGEQGLGDGIAGGGTVQLEDADVPGGGGREVRDLDEGSVGFRGVETASGDFGCGDGRLPEDEEPGGGAEVGRHLALILSRIRIVSCERRLNELRSANWR